MPHPTPLDAPDAVPGRLRRHAAWRALRRETRLHPADLIAPIFVAEADELAGDVASMPGVRRVTVDGVGHEVERLAGAGVGAVLIFGLPVAKDPFARAADDDAGVVPRAIRAARVAVPTLAILTDVCLCAYTDHGHCAVLRDDGSIDLNRTLPRLAAVAVAHAHAGADVVAPSAMLDGQVAAIRAALDQNALHGVGVMSYAVKYASAYYGPFRDAAQSAPSFGDRRGHQLDPANVREALAEAAADVRQGADWLMVKPAGAYLDVIRGVRDAHPSHPLAAYQVSGEYAMIHAAAERGWIDGDAVMLESLLAIRRAGADAIITYFAADAAMRLRQG